MFLQMDKTIPQMFARKKAKMPMTPKYASGLLVFSVADFISTKNLNHVDFQDSF